MDKDLSELRRAARNLRVTLHVGRAGVTEAVVDQVRQMLRSNNLIKVRITADDRQAVAEAAASLARRVPCRLVERTGFVAIFQSSELAVAAAAADSPSEVE